MERQLYLIKHGRFDYNSINNMPLYELNWYFNKLQEWDKEAAGIDPDEMTDI